MKHTPTPTLPVRTAPRLALAISAALLAGYGSAHAATYPVTVSDDPGDASVAGTLSHAIRAANVNPGADIIELQTDVTVKGVMKTLIDGAPSGGDHDTGGGDLTLQSTAGSTYSISGGDQFRPLFIKSGIVTIKNLMIRNGLAKGGDSGRGGGGAGLGGGLFVYDGTVLIDNVTFNNNHAQGGSIHDALGIGGGGMFGAGDGPGGGGLFASSTSNSGAYGGNGSYGGGSDGGFGSGGSGGSAGSGDGGHSGGFGGGGGSYHNGGFGGGGGGSSNDAGSGGFGGGGGGSTDFGRGGFGGGSSSFGGGGAGFGGAIFAMKGTLTLKDVSFSGNAVTAGVGDSPFSTDNDDGSAAAKDVFICTRSVGNNHPSAALCAATVNQCGTTSTNEVVGTLGSTCDYAISTTAVPAAGGAVTCDPNPVTTTGSTTCTATPDGGYTFSHWSGDCTGDAGCTLDSVAENKNVTGNFSPIRSARVGSTQLTISGGALRSFRQASLSSDTIGTPTGMAFNLGAYSYSVVGLNTTIPEAITVILTIADTLPVGAKLYKVNNAGYTEITGVTINGNTATFSITDNGSLDTNPALGTIDDPIAIGTPATSNTGGGAASSGGGGSVGELELLLAFSVLAAALRRRLFTF